LPSFTVTKINNDCVLACSRHDCVGRFRQLLRNNMEELLGTRRGRQEAEEEKQT